MSVLTKAREIDCGDTCSIAGLFAIAAWLYRDHLLNSLVFLGNPDRIHNNLKVLKFHVDNLVSNSGLQAWNEHELLGYDSFTLPYINPNPLTYLVAIFGGDNLYITAGYISALLLALSGVAAYFFVRDAVQDKLAAFAGASLYMLASITVLKVSQNDASFIVFVLIPPLMLAARRMSVATPTRALWTQALLLYLLLQFAFLQKVAYAILLWGTYNIYLASSRGEYSRLLVALGALIAALCAAAPRIAGVALALPQYTRGSSETLSKPGISQPLEFFRWFDSTIFGRYYGDATWALNSINLSEGFLLYTSCFAPFVLVLCWHLSREKLRGEERFFLVTVVTLFSLIVIPWLMKLVWILFAKISFLHSRILIIALLPLVTLISSQLARISSGLEIRLTTAFFGLIVAALMVVGIEMTANYYLGAVYLDKSIVMRISEIVWKVAPVDWTPVAFEKSAIIRISLSAMAALILVLIGLRCTNRSSRSVAYIAIAGATILQAIISSNFQLNGPQTRNIEQPFLQGNISWSAVDSFRPPSASERESLQRRVQAPDFRSVVICDRKVAGGFCAGHYSEYWKLRLADGYFGFGAPVRLAALPLSSLGMRELSFTGITDLPWALLGYLNVKYALLSTPGLYGYGPTKSRVSEASIIENPEPVLPRAFFARSIEPVSNPRQAASLIFSNDSIRDVKIMSFVEGKIIPKQYGTQGDVQINGTGDLLTADFLPVSSPRFLVINELYNSNWIANIDGKTVPVFAANVTMRGIEVPPGASRITLQYKPVASFQNCLAAFIAGIFLAWAATAMIRIKPLSV